MDLEQIALMRYSELKGLTIAQLKTAVGIGERRARRLHAILRRKKRLAPNDTTDADQVLNSTRYEFDETALTYHFYWQGRNGPLVVNQENVRSMVRSYTVDGGNLSMQQVAIQHGITRREFERIKIALGITKDHEPFTPEDLEARSEDDLFSDYTALKRNRLQKRVEGFDHRRTKDYAARWQKLLTGSIQPILEAVHDLMDGPTPEPRPLPLLGEDEVAIHIHASDLHLGMYSEGWTSDRGQYNVEIAKERYLDGVLVCAQRLAHAYPSPGERPLIIQPLGGDMVHCDNTQGRTSSLRNTMDMDVVPERAAIMAVKLAAEGIQSLLAAGFRVHCCLVRGNHDSYTDVLIYQAMRYAFAAEEDVTFDDNDIHNYSIYMFGDYVIIEHHGHGIKSSKDLGSLAAAWARDKGLAYKQAFAFTGNLHHLKNEEEAGILLFQQPSAAGTDRYHELNAYGHRSRPAIAGYAISASRGWLGMHYEAFE